MKDSATGHNAENPAGRRVTNGKSVLEVDAKCVIYFASNFSHTLLCDVLTFSTGSACACQDKGARLERMGREQAAWEEYARRTYEAHARTYQAESGKLRFLQYVNQASRSYWEARIGAGAILL